jgi:hypothetical protein
MRPRTRVAVTVLVVQMGERQAMTVLVVTAETAISLAGP